MLWEAATGKRPWKGLAVVSMIDAVLAGHFPAPCSSNPTVPIELEAIILKALSFDRRSRYQTAAELQSAIDGYLDTVGGRLAQREVGKLISTHFASERAVITSVIEEQLQASAHPSPGEPQPLPLLIQPATEGDRDTIEPQTPAETETGTPAASALTIRDAAWRVGSSSSAPGQRAPSDPPSSSAAAKLLARVRTAFRPRPVLAAAIILAVIAIGVARHRTLTIRDLATMGASPSDPASTRIVSGSSGATSSAPASAPAVQLQLAASPAQARFFLDDVPLEGNPFRSERASDGVAHRLRVEAPGFVSRQETITLDRNTFIDIELVGDAAVSPTKTSASRDGPRPHASSPAGPTRAPIIVRHW
jgi:eukaryotic-like serine/threonine-protein kinase